MKILVTGAAGFIGYHTVKALLKNGHKVVGIDNLNDYYDPKLKYARLKELGIHESDAQEFLKVCKTYDFTFLRMNLEDRIELPRLFKNENFDVVCNLAAQAGVRYSIENPNTYIDSNVVGFLNLLECCRHQNIKHLVYASSSSVYGANTDIPFKESQKVDTPISLYAATKKSNELMAFTYSHLYKINTTGLRFFTVYGPWNRPDMAIYLFAEAIANNSPIKVFNEGNMERDFTYIDDIVEGIVKVIETSIKSQGEEYNIFNIGHSKSVKLIDFITSIETHMGKSAEKIMMPMQPGDIHRTWADVSGLEQRYGYRPSTSINDGVKEFVQWYMKYSKI